MRYVLIPLLILLVLVTSGCVNTSIFTGNRPEETVKNFAEVKDFLTVHPDADLKISFRSEGAISDISMMCGPYFKIIDHWEVVFSDSGSNSSLTVWLEKESKQLACLYGEGVDSPKPYIPGPVKADLFITGFSNLEVSGSSTEFYDQKLHLYLGNPEPDRIIIKKVTASYLDDVIENVTNSGIINHGKSFGYSFDFSNTIQEDDLFWIDVEVLYDIPDLQETNQKSRGTIISGVDANRVIQCSSASFEVSSYNFYVGTRILNIEFRNTGNVDLRINSLFRNEYGGLEDATDPFTLEYNSYKSIQMTGVNKIKEAIIFVSEACPGAQQVIFIEDIAGV